VRRLAPLTFRVLFPYIFFNLARKSGDLPGIAEEGKMSRATTRLLAFM
jgi:hypothetical protein